MHSALCCCERSCRGREMMLGCSRCLQSPLPVLFRSEAFGGGRQFTPRLWVSPSSAVGSLRRAELWSQARVLLRSPRRQGGHHHPARPVPAAGRAALLPCGRGENLLRDPAQSHDPQPRGECPRAQSRAGLPGQPLSRSQLHQLGPGGAQTPLAAGWTWKWQDLTVEHPRESRGSLAWLLWKRVAAPLEMGLSRGAG